MPTFTYSPTERVTIAPNGDVTFVDGATSTTYSKAGGTKTVTKTPPDANPPPPENAFTNQTKPNGDVVQQYTDLTATPPVTVKITFHPNGNIDITISRDEIQVRTQVIAASGVRQSHTWKQGTPEPTTFTPQKPTNITKNPPSAGSSTAPVGSPTSSGGGKKKPKKKPGKNVRKAKKPARKKAGKPKKKKR